MEPLTDSSLVFLLTGELRPALARETTMSVEIERASKSLFPAEGARVSNVKFFLGNSRGVSADQLAGQLTRADAQIRNGLCAADKLDRELTVTNI